MEQFFFIIIPISDDGEKSDRVSVNIETRTPAPAETPGFISESELRKRLPLCRKTLFNLRRDGKLPHLKIGSRVIYDWDTVKNRFLRMQVGAE